MSTQDHNVKKHVIVAQLERRASYRLPINLGVLIRLAGDGSYPPQAVYREEELTPWEAVDTNNLSETGLSVNSRTGHTENTCLQIMMRPESTTDMDIIFLLGMVRRVEKIRLWRRRYYRLGIEFLPFEEKVRRRIAKFIFKKQRQAMRIRKHAQFKNMKNQGTGENN